MNSRRYWVLFSITQRATHCEPVQVGLTNNLRNLTTGRLQDYVPIAEFPDEKSAMAFQDGIHHLVPDLVRLNGGQQ